MAKTVQEELQDQLRYSGLTRWHDKGITGRDVVVWNMENDRAEHGQMTTIRAKHSAPNAKVINATLSMSYDGKEIYYSNAILNDGTKIPTEEFIKQNNIKILTRSVGGSFSGGASTKFWKELQDKYKLIIFNSYGNEGTGSGTDNDEIAILVGACGLGATVDTVAAVAAVVLLQTTITRGKSGPAPEALAEKVAPAATVGKVV